MNRNRIAPVFVLIIAIGLLAFYFKRYRVPPTIDLPAIALTDMSGRRVDLRDMSGHPLLISFFATWCGPCIHELPEFAVLQDSMAAEHLQVVCISDEPIDQLQNISARMAGRLLILHSETAMKDICVYTFPTNYIYDARGHKVYNKTGPDLWADPAVLAHIRASLAK